MFDDFRHFSDAMTMVNNSRSKRPTKSTSPSTKDSPAQEADAYSSSRPTFSTWSLSTNVIAAAPVTIPLGERCSNTLQAATQIGLTATPKETDEVSNIDYFGDPLYTYSLKQGIEDGFLAPYKVMSVTLDIDADGCTTAPASWISMARRMPDRLIWRQDFDRTIVIDERTRSVAKRITDFLKATDRFTKTIVFCVDIEHAESMRRPWSTKTRTWPREIPNMSCRSPGTTRGQAGPGRLHRAGRALPGHRHHLQAHDHRRRRPNLPPHRPRLQHQLHDRVQADHRPRHPYQGRFREALFTIMDFRNATRLFETRSLTANRFRLKSSEPGQSAYRSTRRRKRTVPVKRTTAICRPAGTTKTQPTRQILRRWRAGQKIVADTSRVAALMAT